MLNKITYSDVLDGVKKINNNSVHLTATSPPYNVKIDYDNHEDNAPYKEYLEWLKKIFTEIYRVTVYGGRCVINIDMTANDKEMRDEEYIRAIYPHLYNLMKEIGWKFRTEICWYKQNAVGNPTCWGSWLSCSDPFIRRNHEYVLVWSKGDWRLDGDIELSDMTRKEFETYTLSTWFITPETRKNILSVHPAPFPEELAQRIIKLFSYRENTVLDMFCGSGTVPYISKLLGRNYIGIDNSENYCSFARSRVDSVNGMLFQDTYVPRSERIKKTLSKRKTKKKEASDKVDLFNE